MADQESFVIDGVAYMNTDNLNKHNNPSSVFGHEGDHLLASTSGFGKDGSSSSVMSYASAAADSEKLKHYLLGLIGK